MFDDVRVLAAVVGLDGLEWAFCGRCDTPLLFTGIAFRTGGDFEGVGGKGLTGSLDGTLNIVTIADVLGRGCVVRELPRVAPPRTGPLELAVRGAGHPWSRCGLSCNSDLIGG